MVCGGFGMGVIRWILCYKVLEGDDDVINFDCGFVVVFGVILCVDGWVLFCFFYFYYVIFRVD